MEVSRYHKFLRVSMVVVALVLLFDSGLVSPLTKQLSDNTIHYLASSVTGMSASVEPNEYNEITAQLTEWETSLQEREAALNGRTIATRDFGIEEQTDYSVYILSTILFILTVLIVLNYALDWVRVRRLNYERKAA